MTEYKYLNKLHGQRVLVIGGTKGIGYGVAEAAIENGANVIVASRNQSNVDLAVKQLQKSYPELSDNITGAHVDITAKDIEGELKRFFNGITENGQHPLNHIVETVGDGLPQVQLDTLTVEKLESESRLRMVGMTMLAKVARGYMASPPSHNSSFTMTTGGLIDKPLPGFGVVSAIGAYKEGLARGLAVDMSPMRVNVVSPGVIRTSMQDLAVQGDPDRLEKMLEHAAAANVLKRIGTIEDSAEVYLGVMRSGYITGTVVAVNGGFYLK